MNAGERRAVAFLDIGTNSVRLLIVRFNTSHSYTIVTQQKETVRLGEGEFLDDWLRPEPMQRAVLVCRKFAELARFYGANDIIAAATSATREAGNQAEFLSRLRQEAGLDVRVISGREEARLIYLGVASGFHLGEKRGLFIDIGGGSTEIIVGTQTEYEYLDSLKLGAVRLTLLYLPEETGPISASQYALLQRHVRHASVRTTQALRLHPADIAIGSSGTIENLADIAIETSEGRKRTRDDVLTYAQLQRVVALLCSKPLSERRKIAGINPERADIIIAGAAIIDTLMSDLGLKELSISERGVRDGLLVDYLTRLDGGQSLTQLSVRERSVLQLGHTCNFDERHSRQVARLALQLFDSGRQLRLHTLGPAERELLEYAALLHDIGSFISYNNHHAHADYLIRNSDLLGFDQREIALMAATTLFHRKSLPTRKHPGFAALTRQDQHIVTVLSALLRLAESLDRSHAGRVTRASWRLGGRRNLVLALECADDCQLELWGVQNHLKAVEKTFGRQMTTETISPASIQNASSAFQSMEVTSLLARPR